MRPHARRSASDAARRGGPAASSLLELMERSLADPGADLDRLDRVAVIYERALAREAEQAFARALIQIQRRLPVLDELGEVTDESGAVKSTYASWEDTVETIRPILFRWGFALSFKPGLSPRGEPMVVGVLRHEAGHKEEAELVLPADVSGGKNVVQAVGSSLSYGQRYVTKLLLNLASRKLDEDDDGQMGGSGEAERDAIAEINALEDEDAFPAWKRANRRRLGDLAPAAFQRVIGCYNTRLARIRAQRAPAA
jgi:ERF superfamily